VRDDLDALVDLGNHAARGGEAELEPLTRHALEEFLRAPEVDPARDLQVWTDGRGVAGFARVWVLSRGDERHAVLFYSIRDDDAALERAAIDWAAARLGAEAHPRRRLIHDVAVRDPDRAARLAALGFAVRRIRLSMGRPVPGPPIDAPLPPGYRIRSVRPGDDADGYAAVFNETFADTHDFTPMTAASFLHDTTDPAYRAELDLVLEAPGGALAGFSYQTIDPDTPRTGYLNAIGVARAHRRRGLDAALIAAAIGALDARGVREVHLSADEDSPSAAPRIYERLGFAIRFRCARMALPLDNVTPSGQAAPPWRPK
jgi:ribosomal protein S18 acetylase RimI-like enzyme